MADNTPRWLKDAQRIAPTPSARPTYTAPPTYRQQEVTQAEISRIRAGSISSSKAGKK